MRVIVIGFGVQGRKRRAIAGSAVAAVVDLISPEADYKTVEDVPLNTFDAALVCTPDNVKIDLLSYLLNNNKHVLVEKPLFAATDAILHELAALAKTKGVTCYTAYNHRFEPHFIRMKETIASGKLGTVYSLRMFYGNGTARLVRDSAWRDQGAGVLPDLGSHLLDTVLFWLGPPLAPFHIQSCNRFENRAFDHVTFAAAGLPFLQMETTLLSWRNHFYADVFGANGSAHIRSLCKWGPSTFTVRNRKLPSGRPDEQSTALIQGDPTWQAEYDYFCDLCQTGKSNIDNDIWLNGVLNVLANEALALNPSPPDGHR